MQLVISLNEERRNKEDEDIADSHGSNPQWIGTDVLTRYNNHGYCEVDMANPSIQLCSDLF